MRPVTVDSAVNPLRPIISEKQDNCIFLYPLSSLCHGLAQLERGLKDTHYAFLSNMAIFPIMPTRKDPECCQWQGTHCFVRQPLRFQRFSSSLLVGFSVALIFTGPFALLLWTHMSAGTTRCLEPPLSVLNTWSSFHSCLYNSPRSFQQ